MPLIYALQWNVFFESIHINDAGKFSSDLASCLVAVVQRNTNIKEFAVTGSSVASKEFFSTLADSISANANSKLTILDFSSVAVDEKSASSLASILYCLPNGLSSLRMVDCSLSKKSASSILAALKKTPLKTSESESSSSLNVVHASKFSMSLVDSLVHLDLSQNALPAEAVLALSEYLAMPNHLKKLSLSQCSIPNTEVLFGALVRGCLQELQQLELDGNKFTISESVNVAFVCVHRYQAHILGSIFQIGSEFALVGLIAHQAIGSLSESSAKRPPRKLWQSGCHIETGCE